MNEIMVFVKPVGDSCNLMCDYCFNASSPNKSERMSMETYQNILEMIKDIPNITMIFHGGEPLLMGHDFFDNALSMQSDILNDNNVTTTIQTNLISLDDNWIDIIQKNDIGIGTSLDGTQDIHDNIRHYSDGKGSYEKVCKGIKMLNQAGIKIGAITTYTKLMEGRGLEVYESMRESGLYGWKLNCMVKSGRDNDDVLSADVDVFAKDFIEMADRYMKDKDCPKFKTVNMLLNSYFIAKDERPMHKYNCQRKEITIDSDGSIYPCGRFTDMPNFKLGEVGDDIEIIFGHDIKNKMTSDYEDCKICEYDKSCHLRCPYNSLVMENAFGVKDNLCIVYKSFFNHMDNIFGGVLNGREVAINA